MSRWPSMWTHIVCDVATGCWIWVGHIDKDGYGKYRQTTAQRAVYTELVGPIPPKHDLDHLCRNHPCVRPDHLEPVTRLENLRRGNTNVAKTICIRGHDDFVPRKDGRGRRCLTCDTLRNRHQIAA